MTSSRMPANVVDHVGSLKRPPELVTAWREWEAGKLPFEALRDVQDNAIRGAIAMQEALGLPVVTDGEFRRGGWSRGFLGAVEGFDFRASKLAFRNDEGFSTASPAPVAARPVRRAVPIVTGDFKFIKSIATHRAKVTMPTPSHMHFGQFKAAVDPKVYPDVAKYWDDLIAVFQEEIKDLYAAGCRYLQIDDTNLPFLCDPNLRGHVRALGEDPDALPRLYVRMLNESLRGKPTDMAVCMHMCRGNHASSWVAEGGYDPIAAVVFSEMNVDGFFLEYDSPRAGSFEPLRHLDGEKIAVLGLVTTKKPKLESKDELKRRIEEAARYVPLDRLALSPQCGFASTIEGNALTADDQKRKLELVVETAREVWGHA